MRPLRVPVPSALPHRFYMAMREKYTKPGASIHYYLIEWDPKKLSWQDFRMKVLGATDPATGAPPPSARAALRIKP